MQAASELARRLTNEMVGNVDTGKNQVGEKRKFDNRNFRRNNNSTFKKPTPVVKNYVAMAPLEAAFGYKRLNCPKCTTYHRGECPSCFKCKKPGNIARYCREQTARACYECGDPNHLRNACPKSNVNQGAAGNQARGRDLPLGQMKQDKTRMW
jgi:hypothetical protein